MQIFEFLLIHREGMRNTLINLLVLRTDLSIHFFVANNLLKYLFTRLCYLHFILIFRLHLLGDGVKGSINDLNRQRSMEVLINISFISSFLFACFSFLLIGTSISFSRYIII